MARRFVLLTLVLAMAFAGCSSGDTESDATPETATATTTTTTTEAQPAVEVPGPGEPWDLLFIRASWFHSDRVPEMYAELAAEALGVEIRLHDASMDPRDASLVLSQLQGVAYPPLDDLARQAEIIVVGGEPERSGPDRTETVLDDEGGKCDAEIPPLDADPPVVPTEQQWQPYRDILDAIFAEIWSLREGTPTVIIAAGLHNGGIAKYQREEGIAVVCSAYFEAMNGVVEASAEEHGAVTVSLFELFNGPDGTLDPWEMGYTGGEPGVPWARTNEAGSRMVAEALAAAGFEPTTQP